MSSKDYYTKDHNGNVVKNCIVKNNKYITHDTTTMTLSIILEKESSSIYVDGHGTAPIYVNHELIYTQATGVFPTVYDGKPLNVELGIQVHKDHPIAVGSIKQLHAYGKGTVVVFNGESLTLENNPLSGLNARTTSLQLNGKSSTPIIPDTVKSVKMWKQTIIWGPRSTRCSYSGNLKQRDLPPMVTKTN